MKFIIIEILTSIINLFSKKMTHYNYDPTVYSRVGVAFTGAVFRGLDSDVESGRLILLPPDLGFLRAGFSILAGTAGFAGFTVGQAMRYIFK